MIVLNGRRIIALANTYTNSQNNSVSVKTVSGTTKSWSTESSLDPEFKKIATVYEPNNSSISGDSKKGIVMQLGTGSTAPAPEDYCLESIATDLTVSSASREYSQSGSVIFTYEFYNSSSEDITVTEAAVFLQSFQYDLCAMLAREVIDPVTVEAYSSKTFTFELSFA